MYPLRPSGLMIYTALTFFLLVNRKNCRTNNTSTKWLSISMERTSGISRGMVKQCQCNQHQGETFLMTISHQLFHWDIFEIQGELSECNNQVLTLLPLCDVAQEQPVGDLWSSPALLHRPTEHWGRDRAPELEDCKLQEYSCHLRKLTLYIKGV